MYTYIMPSKLYVNIYLLYLYIIHGLKCVYIYNTNIADSSHGPALRISIQHGTGSKLLNRSYGRKSPAVHVGYFYTYIYIYIHNIYIPISSMLGYTCPPFSIKSPNCVTAPCIVIAENLEETPIFNVFRRMASCTCTCHQPT